MAESDLQFLKLIGLIGGRDPPEIARQRHDGAVALSAAADNRLVLNAHEVRDLSNTTNSVKVPGNAGDTVEASAGWTGAGSVIEGGITFDAYSPSDSTLLVRQEISSQIIV